MCLWRIALVGHPLRHLSALINLFLVGWVLLMTVFVILAVPETKGVPIEELSEVIVNKHWLWSRVVNGAPVPPEIAQGIHDGSAEVSISGDMAVRRLAKVV